MTRYESYNIDNDMWYKKRKHIYHLMGVYDGGLSEFGKIEVIKKGV